MACVAGTKGGGQRGVYRKVGKTWAPQKWFGHVYFFGSRVRVWTFWAGAEPTGSTSKAQEASPAASDLPGTLEPVWDPPPKHIRMTLEGKPLKLKVEASEGKKSWSMSR